MTRSKCLLTIPLLFASSVAAADRPNIIVIFTDDHGYADLSCQGIVDDIRTPHIDALAAGGVRMTSGYVTAPQCVPSRAGLLSGQYQNRLGVESNGQPLDRFNAAQTIAERLKPAGYATGMIGKWHLGPSREIVDHGFDDVFYQGGSWTNYDIDGNDVAPGSSFKEMYHLDAKSAAARAFIKRHHQQPFFLYVAYRAPHVPLDATKKYLDRFPSKMPQRRRQALAMLSAVDDGVGGVIETLREYNLEEKTLVFFIGDNGAPLKIHKIDAPGGGPGWDGSLNDPLNGEKGMLSEGGIRVPFVVSWKGKIDGRQTYEHPVISLDVAATAISLAGLPADPKLDGVDLIPFLTGQNDAAPHETLYWRWIAQSAVREGKWKYLRGGARNYLFDVASDREEKNNLIAKHPDIARRLEAKLIRWSDGLSPPGLNTKSMSQTWEQYFDYYLDGKPVPKPRGRDLKPRSDRVNGWVIRQAEFSLGEEALRLRPTQRKSLQPFMAAAGLDFPRNVTVVTTMRTRGEGKARVAWRELGQKDFPSQSQVVDIDCQPSSAAVRYASELRAGERIIHLRLHLPRNGADVKSIAIEDGAGETLRSWRFDGD